VLYSTSMRDPNDFYERLRAVMRAVRAEAAETYAELDLGSAQAKLLRHMDAGTRISQAELARLTETAPTLTGRSLDPLVERGWIRRTRSEQDRRQYVLELTASGQRARERVLLAREEIIRRVTGALDERDVDDFDRIAGKILATLAARAD